MEFIDMEAEDIHTFIEGELTKRIGDNGKRLHTSRSRNDQVALDTKLYLKKEGIKYVFYQDIFRLPDMKMVIKANVETVCIVNGRLGESALLDDKFTKFFNRL